MQQQRRSAKKNKDMVDVSVRIRPLTADEVTRGEAALDLETKYDDKSRRHQLELTTPKTANDDIECVEVLGNFRVPKSKPQKHKNYRGFSHVAAEGMDNDQFFQTNVSPLVDDVFHGKTACCFAYGHTGSGKTHTVLGNDNELGMYHQASVKLFEEFPSMLESYAQTEPEIFHNEKESPLIQVRFGEIYNDNVYDLLNGRKKCFIREDANRKIQIRGETIALEDGSIRSSFATKLHAHAHEELVQIVRDGIAARATGNSNVHQHSSRSHAILELEITSQQVVDIESHIEAMEIRSTQVGHERDTLELGIYFRQRMQVGTQWVMKPDAKGSTEEERKTLKRLKDELTSLKKEIVITQEKLKECLSTRMPCLGGTLVFIDLAGSEHAGNVHDGIQKTEQEQQECREINRSLSALKGCFRSLADGSQSNSAYRQSKLTMVLRDHLRCTDSKTLMIAAVSPSSLHANKTIHTLQYAQMVAVC